ncbi:MAG: endopeptidase La, partial [Clostridia bacterium]|nr:endopeptidase La [Clostridia bacterium]
PDSTVRLMVHGEQRVKVVGVVEQGAFLTGDFEPMPMSGDISLKTQAQIRFLKKLFSRYAKLYPDFSGELIQAVNGEKDHSTVVNLIAANVMENLDDKMRLLETDSLQNQIDILIDTLTNELKLFEIESSIQKRVFSKVSFDQKAYFLREQMKAIKNELGEDDDDDDLAELSEKIDSTPMNDEARAQAKRELTKLSHTAPGSPEASVSRNYIQCLLDLPWEKNTRDQLDLTRARKVLERDHFGLEKVKQRILEYLAVGMLKGNMHAGILCLVGPPGVGKTSIAMSVASATGRKFTRMSLGGVHDEAEIRGHRRTYLGSMPGKLISNLKKCGVMNPVFLLDEIDKIGSDYRGDPASALLEALDPEQNSTFEDHYIDAPFDLSQVLFMTTANSVETIPAPLLDRMDVIHLGGYTPNEKLEIALRHLWPKQLKENGLTRSQVRIRRDAINEIISGYTREAGVRELERQLASICRKAAVKIIEGETTVNVNKAVIEEMLRPRLYLDTQHDKQPQVGVVNALAWTNYGGDTLSIQVAAMPGKGNIDLTGCLGDVMKESARTAHSYIRSRSAEFGIDPEFYKNHDLHIHVPEGATPKDGPSAGIAMCLAMVSAMTGRRARQDAAMTGEITLTGRALAIGGVKEKTLAADRMGMKMVLMPRDNEKDLRDLPEDVLKRLDIRLISNVDEALRLVLAEGK